MNGSPQRKTNIELLRIIVSIGVVFLHLNYTDSAGLLAVENNGSLNYAFSCVTETVFVCAVNVFLVISGYFMANQNSISFEKIIRLLLQVSFFGFIGYFIVKLADPQFALAELLINCIPHNYYVTFYVCLLIFAPFLTKLCKSISEKNFSSLVLISLLVVCVYPFFVSCMESIVGVKMTGMSTISLEGDISGYSLPNFIVVFMVGSALTRKSAEVKAVEIKLVLCLVCVFLFRYVINSPLKGVVFNYNDPLLIMIAAYSFVLFKKIRIKENKVIGYIGKSTLGVYLIHPYVIRVFGYNWAVNASIIMYIGYQLLIICVCFSVSVILTIVFNSLFKLLTKIPFVNHIISLKYTVD